MKNYRIHIILTLTLLSTCSNIFGQYLPDGTFATIEYINEITSNQDQEKKFLFDTSYSNLNVRLSLELFIVKDQFGQNNIDEATINESITILNEFFLPIGVLFTSGKIKEVNEYEYSYISNEGANPELMEKYAIRNKINIFLVEAIEFDSIPYYAYTHFPNDTMNTNIFVRKYNMSGKNLTTQMGHFFGLLSTHETIGGVELVDTSNCNYSGDYLCDTYPDFGVYNLVNSDCLYKGENVDNNNQFYAPSVANLMSDSPEKCKCVFTISQYRRMYYYFKNYRSNILTSNQ